MFVPAYQRLGLKELVLRAEKAVALMDECHMCARQCGTPRVNDDSSGYCGVGRRAQVASFGRHFGEERPLVGSHGSGTIFFAGCNLRCVFCQNCDISQLYPGEEVAPEELAAVMLALARRGCHNINFVTPTHVVAQILEALPLAAQAGLDVPLVYNCGGYEATETLELLDGVVDIYMPDAKYADPEAARLLSDAADYPEVMMKAISEMHRQVGDLQIDERGIATRGLLVRHLVLPNNMAGTEKIVEFLAQKCGPNTYLNVMDQYRPHFRAHEFRPINRRITSEEYLKARDLALAAGLTRLDKG